MSDSHLGDLLGSFLTESRKLLDELQILIGDLGTDQGRDAWSSIEVLTHRLKGSAALYGFEHLSRLAGEMEVAVERAPEQPEESERVLVAHLPRVRSIVQSLAENGTEQAGRSRPIDPSVPASPHRAESMALQLGRFGRNQADVLDFFLPEAEEHLEGIYQDLREAAAEESSTEVIDTLFRRWHTLKGAALTVGCAPIGELAHDAEDLLVQVRTGEVRLSVPARRALARCADAVVIMLKVVGGGGGATVAEAVNVARRALAALTTRDDLEAAAKGSSDAASAPTPIDASEPIQEQDPLSVPPSQVDEPVAALAPQRPAAEGVQETPWSLDLSDLEPEAESSSRPIEARATVRVDIGQIDEMLRSVGDLVVSRHRLDRQIESHRTLEKPFGELRDRLRSVSWKVAEAAERKGSEEPPIVRRALPRVAGQSLADIFSELELDRYHELDVLSRRLDEIVSDFGEVQAEVDRSRQLLERESTQILRSIRSLRTHLGQTRMVTAGSLFGRFRRRVESLAEELHKQVALEVRGEAVEMDSAIAEELVDPVMHLIQNALVHGFESTETRLRLGKQAVGKLGLHAYPEGSSVLIEVSDDGAGVDVESVRNRALALYPHRREEIEGAEDDQVLPWIFEAGLSTHAEVSEAAGRGVGLDVVRENLRRIGGLVEVHNEVGGGTRFILRVPLTLIVSEALRVRVGSQFFAISTSVVEQTVQFPSDHIHGSDEERTVFTGGRELPVRRASTLLDLPSEATARLEQGVILRSEGRSWCLIVDQLLEIEEVVARGIGNFLRGLDYLAGAVVAKEGKVELLLDPVGLWNLSSQGLATSVSPVEEAAVPSAPRILLVDDSLSVRKILGRRLSRMGFDLSVASDGIEAQETLREENFDALVTDLEMPNLNGYELVEWVRQRPASKHLPVIVVTTRTGRKHSELAARLGVTDYLPKPVDEAVLARELRRLTGRDPIARVAS
ncbi:MAG: Hpt domain-containing protein [Acidobacteriota bacterium]